MSRIKVTGYLYTEDLDVEDVDLDHEMGLSDKGFQKYSRILNTLDDIEFVQDPKWEG